MISARLTRFLSSLSDAASYRLWTDSSARIPFAACFGAALIVLYLCFSAAIYIPYVTRDQTRFFFRQAPIIHNYTKVDVPLHTWFPSHGRPLSGEIESAVALNTYGLYDLSEIRLLALILLALGVAVLTGMFIRGGLSVIPAFSLSAAVFVLPGAQNAVFMLALPNAINALLGLLTFGLLTAGQKGGPAKILLAGLILLMSMFNYAPLSFFFIVPLFALFLFNIDKGDAVLLTLRHFIFLIGTAVLYYILVRLFLYVPAPVTDTYAFQLSPSNAIEKVGFFFSDLLPILFNLWNIHTADVLGAVVCNLFVFTFLLAIYRQDRTKRTALTKLITLCGFFMISLCTWFLSPTLLTVFRILWVGQALALIAVAWTGFYWLRYFGRSERWGNVWAIVILAAGAICANYTMVKNVWNSNLEIMFIRNAIVSHQEPYKRIHVIMPEEDKVGFNGLSSVVDDFHCKTTFHKFDTPLLVRAALSGLPASQQWICSCLTRASCLPVWEECPGLTISVSEAGQPLGLPEETLVIDMNDLRRATQSLR